MPVLHTLFKIVATIFLALISSSSLVIAANGHTLPDKPKHICHVDLGLASLPAFLL